MNGLVGAAGVVVTILALALALAGAGRGLLGRAELSGADVVALLLIVLGFGLLCGVVVGGYWLPMAPLVPGITLAAAGVTFVIWDSLLIDIFQLLPDSEAAHLFVLWGRTGVPLGLGVLMIAAWLLTWLPRGRRLPQR